MTLKVFTTADEKNLAVKYINTSKTNTVYVKNIGTAPVTLYRVLLSNTDMLFTVTKDEFGEGSSDTLITNDLILPGQTLKLYLSNKKEVSNIIATESLVGITLEYV